MTNSRWFLSWLLIILTVLGPVDAFATTPTTESKYGTNNQSITCTLTSVTNNTQWGCTAVDNTSNLFLDVLVFIKIKTSSSALSTGSFLNVYAAGTADGGTTYSDGIACSNASVTLTSPPNVKLIGIINAPSTSTTYNAGPFSVAVAFNGILPDHWCIVVENKTGQTTDASVGSAWYQGVQTQTPSL